MSEAEKDEAQRQCPACRNWVSFLATKCHYCGETLGRPRKEEMRKTVQDLGGESKTQYTVSGNVMDALEAFREENLSEQEGIRRQKEELAQTWFGKKNLTHESGGAQAGMPELDEQHKSLADDILGEDHGAASRSRQHTPPPRRVDSDLIRNIGIAIVVLVVAGAGYAFGWPALQDYLAERNKPVMPEHNNVTRDKIVAGDDALSVLQAAHEAVDVAPTEENRAILDEARDYVGQQVRALLDASEFRGELLDQASALTNKAALLDQSEAILKLADEVKQEVQVHKFILTEVNADSTKAKFKLNNADAASPEQEVGVGDMLQDRFIVTAITNASVRLEDTRRIVHGRQRPLVSRPYQAVRGS